MAAWRSHRRQGGRQDSTYLPCAGALNGLAAFAADRGRKLTEGTGRPAPAEASSWQPGAKCRWTVQLTCSRPYSSGGEAAAAPTSAAELGRSRCQSRGSSRCQSRGSSRCQSRGSCSASQGQGRAACRQPQRRRRHTRRGVSERHTVYAVCFRAFFLKPPDVANRQHAEVYPLKLTNGGKTLE